MNTRTRIVCLVVVVATLLGIYRMDSRLDCAPPERPSLVQVIERVNPSVVYVEAYGTYDEYYSDTYGCYYNNGDVAKLWSGSGVIIDPGGLVLTAAHVVNGADRFKITLPDDREFWSDESWHRSEISDVGFIQLDISEKLPISYLGKSSNLGKGEDVFIMGCPFGYELRFTVTKGIVSGLERDCDGFFGKKFILQVDAQSWPGNSGGPVYNMRGRVIGILVGGYYGADGIGLCIPVDIISGILEIYNAEQAMIRVE